MVARAVEIGWNLLVAIGSGAPAGARRMLTKIRWLTPPAKFQRPSGTSLSLLEELRALKMPSSNQTNGSSQAPSMVTPKPAKPMTPIMTDMVRRVSASVMPVMREMIQKPLSFIQETGLEPQPMAKAR